MGIPLYKPGERIRRLDEACQILKLLFTQGLTTFGRRYYQRKDACRSSPIRCQSAATPDSAVRCCQRLV